MTNRFHLHPNGNQAQTRWPIAYFPLRSNAFYAVF